MTETPKREAAYDAYVYPLMVKVLEVCKANNIPMFATFRCDDGDDDDVLWCTSTLPGDTTGKIGRLVSLHVPAKYSHTIMERPA